MGIYGENNILMFECIQERDIDLLLMEEWCVNPDFARFFFKNILPVDVAIAERSAMHSITDDAYGESDVVLTFCSNGRRIAVLVEDKIDAVPQPEQAKRYRLRAKKMLASGQFDEVFICLIAPQHYLDNDAEPYPKRISYESLVDFLADGTLRGEYKANMLRLGISQERRRPKPVKNNLVTQFWQDYREALQAAFPDAMMPFPAIVPINSDWPIIRFADFPGKVRIIHKMAQGNLDLETGLSEGELQNLLSFWNAERITIAQTGKSFVFRIPVPPLNRMQEFSGQIVQVKEAFAGIKIYRNCLQKFGLTQKK